MTTGAANFSEKLATAGARKIARWTADRLIAAKRRIAWHISLWVIQVRNLTGVGGALPPGPVAASSRREVATDDGYFLRLQRLYGSIFKILWGSGDLKICLIGYPLAKRLFREHRNALESVTEDLSALVPHNFLRGMCPEEHRRYRRIFKTAFCDDLIEAREPGIRQIVRDELAKLAAGANSDTPPSNRLYDALNRITLSVQMLFVLGIERDTKMAAELEQHYCRLGPNGHVEHVAPPQAEAFAEIKQAVVATVRSLRDQKSARHGDSVMQRIIDSEPASVIDDTVIGNLIYLVERGRHDLRDLLRWVVKHLSDHPDVVDELRTALADPDGKTGLAPACVLETLRLEQAEALTRRARARIEFEGYTIPKGSWISLLLRESHRDPATFSDPESYCPHRFIDRKYRVDQYAPLGFDEHQCIASSFVIRMATVLIEELVRDYSWTVISDGPRQVGAFHWEPSSSFAIDLQPKS